MFIVPDTSSYWGQEHIVRFWRRREGMERGGGGYGQNIQTSLLFYAYMHAYGKSLKYSWKIHDNKNSKLEVELKNLVLK